VPVGGASEKVSVVLDNEYVSVCWRIPPTNTRIELVVTGASRKVKLTVLLSPLKESIAKVADVGRFPRKANLLSFYIALGLVLIVYSI